MLKIKLNKTSDLVQLTSTLLRLQKTMNGILEPFKRPYLGAAKYILCFIVIFVTSILKWGCVIAQNLK